MYANLSSAIYYFLLKSITSKQTCAIKFLHNDFKVTETICITHNASINTNERGSKVKLETHDVALLDCS